MIYNQLQSITRWLAIKYKYQLQDDYNDLQPITINYKTITMIYNQLQSSVSHNYDQLQGNLQWFQAIKINYKVVYIDLQSILQPITMTL